MSTLMETKDANGTSLSSYAEVLGDKAHDLGIRHILIFSKKVDGEDDIGIVTDIAGEVLGLTLQAIGAQFLARAKQAKKKD